MRNLKKILALVLALVMSFAVMSVSSASFKDASKVDSKFTEAVGVLNGLGVFQGYEDGSFNPKGSITRAEVAAIIYRIDTGDVNDKQVAIYADYNKFDDVKSTAWYAGYVNYCANALYIKGYDENTFGPNDKVTGYQALAMILRAVGYDKNGEFSGSAWQIETAKYANMLGITKNVNANTLGVAATRELVAELLFQTIAYVPQVTYTLALGYNQYQTTLVTETSKLNPTIGKEVFGLDLAYIDNYDNWGRPADAWFSWNLNNIVYFMPYAPISTYTVAVTECEIAQDFRYNGSKDVPTDMYENGEFVTAQINPVHEHINVKGHQIGGQGTIIETYMTPTGTGERIVMIETYLAVVTDTVKEVTDKAGHIKQEAYNELLVYAGDTINDTNVAGVYYLAGNDYATGDYVLVNVNEASENVAEYYAEVTGKASAINAAQTTIWWNAEKHSLDKVEYADNENFTLDAAQYDMSKKYTWLLDSYNNVIGSVEIVTPNTYGVVVGAQWVNGIGVNGYAQGTVRYLDGTTESAVIAKINGIPATYATTVGGSFDAGMVHTTWQYNTDTNAHLYRVVKNSAGALELYRVDNHYDNVEIYSGESAVVGAPVLTDNNTKYLVYDWYTGSYADYVGYDNLPADFDCVAIDVLDLDADIFAEYIYVYGTTIDYVSYNYVNRYIYFTGDMMNFYETKDTFALYGVIDHKADSTPLYFSKGADAAATKAALIEMVKMYQDTLCYVEVLNGIVNEIIPVPTAEGDYLSGKYIPGVGEYVADGEYYFIDTGVLVMADGRALNVNNATTIINDGEIGTKADLSYLKDANLYVVTAVDSYGNATNTVSAIFVTPTTRNVMVNVDGTPVEMTMMEAMVYGLKAEALADVVANFVYEVEEDVELVNATLEAAVVEAVKAGQAVSFIEGMDYAKDSVTVTATVESIEAPTADADGYAVVTVVIANGGVENTFELTVALTLVAAEDAE